jgi:hypothetical protein
MAGARSWPHIDHLPHCRASEWVNLHLHTPYTFVPCKGAALLLPCIILAVFTDLKILGLCFIIGRHRIILPFCTFFIFPPPSVLHIIGINSFLFSLFFSILSNLLPSLNDFVFLCTFVDFLSCHPS